jgi:hypothetical protein
MQPTLIVGPVSEDRRLAAAHEAAHQAMAKFMGARLGACYIWRAGGGWAANFRYGRPDDLDALGERLLNVAGAAGEATVRGFVNPADAARFMSGDDAAHFGADSRPGLMAVPTFEGDIRFALRALGAPLRHAWTADARTLETDLRAGDFARLPARMIPPAWKPPPF